MNPNASQFPTYAAMINANNQIRGVWVMLVGPFGQVQHLEVMPHIGGDVIVKLNEDGDPHIPKRWREKGWCFYEEICSGEKDTTGTSKKVGAKHLEWWHALRDVFASGRRPARDSIDTAKFYHPEILKRRQLDRPDGAVPVSAETMFGKLAAEVAPTASPEPGATPEETSADG